MPVSVPTYSTSALRVSSVSVLMVSPARPPVIGVNVAPKSVLVHTYGAKSFSR